MSEIKREIKIFNVMQYGEEGEYLREMHQKGWAFRRLKWMACYEFEACEPEDMVYQLDYNKEGIDHKAEYVRMFEDCGWEYLQDAFGYSYFRKPASQMEEEEGIFCDDESRMDMLKRVYKGRIVPMIILFFILILPQVIGQGYRAANGDSNTATVLFVTYAVLGAVYLLIFIRMFREYMEFRKKLEG